MEMMGMGEKAVRRRSLVGLLVLFLAVSWSNIANAQDGTLRPENREENGYALDFFAFDYLPTKSRARKASVHYWCGTPIFEFLHSTGGQVEESRLFKRAQRLQRWYAPEELTNGPFVDRDVCKTKGCRGIVPVAFQIEKIQPESRSGPFVKLPTYIIFILHSRIYLVALTYQTLIIFPSTLIHPTSGDNSPIIKSNRLLLPTPVEPIKPIRLSAFIQRSRSRNR